MPRERLAYYDVFLKKKDDSALYAAYLSVPRQVSNAGDRIRRKLFDVDPNVEGYWLTAVPTIEVMRRRVRSRFIDMGDSWMQASEVLLDYTERALEVRGHYQEERES